MAAVRVGLDEVLTLLLLLYGVVELQLLLVVLKNLIVVNNYTIKLQFNGKHNIKFLNINSLRVTYAEWFEGLKLVRLKCQCPSKQRFAN